MDAPPLVPPRPSRARKPSRRRATPRNRNRGQPTSAAGAGGDDVDYLEVRARTVDLAVEAAMTELGIADREQLAVEVLQEPEKGFLGFGGQDAVVRVTQRKTRRRRNERRRTPRETRTEA